MIRGSLLKLKWSLRKLVCGKTKAGIAANGHSLSKISNVSFTRTRQRPLGRSGISASSAALAHRATSPTPSRASPTKISERQRPLELKQRLPPNPARVGNIYATPSYRSLLGERSWEKLHPDIRERFSENSVHREVTYRGVMEEVYASKFGKILANIFRIIGSPLAIHSGANIPTTVRVYRNEKLGGMTWDRFYFFPDDKVDRVKSTKCIRQSVGLIELVGFGFGMYLKLSEKNGALHFESKGFFWSFGKLKISIPDFLSPGKTTVSQSAERNNRFKFTLDVEHKFFGKLFQQVGYFTEQ